MPEHGMGVAVWVIIGVLLSIAGLSVYVSRVFLPAKISKAYLKSITALAMAVETKDSGTIGHAQRVAQLAVDLASRLGIDGEELQQIEYAALLMDIGKANVPQKLLNKRDPLTPEEWEVLQSHPKRGAEMVGAVPFLADLGDYVLHHHEYWDGSGYPDGLAGENIHLASRILGIAADYDAMASDRPYHPRPLSSEEAMEQIRDGIGTRYDPRVAGVFLSMLKAEAADERPAKAA